MGKPVLNYRSKGAAIKTPPSTIPSGDLASLVIRLTPGIRFTSVQHGQGLIKKTLPAPIEDDQNGSHPEGAGQSPPDDRTPRKSPGDP